MIDRSKRYLMFISENLRKIFVLNSWKNSLDLDKHLWFYQSRAVQFPTYLFILCRWIIFYYRLSQFIKGYFNISFLSLFFDRDQQSNLYQNPRKYCQ
jgi:hypothetical protein